MSAAPLRGQHAPHMHERAGCAISAVPDCGITRTAVKAPIERTGREPGGAGAAARLGRPAACRRSLEGQVNTLESGEAHGTRSAQSCRSQRSLCLLPAADCCSKECRISSMTRCKVAMAEPTSCAAAAAAERGLLGSHPPWLLLPTLHSPCFAARTRGQAAQLLERQARHNPAAEAAACRRLRRLAWRRS